MVAIKVKHADYGNKKLRDLISFKRGEELKKVVLANLSEYKTVAKPFLGGSLGRILDDAYRITNSVDEEWISHEDVYVCESAKNGCRSTSVGDIIEVGSEAYIVDSVGFTFLRDLGT